MKYNFSDRSKALKPSVIREIFKYAADPSYISLSAGNPSPEAFPSKQISEISQKLLAENPVPALQYSITEGYPALRTQIVEMMHEQNIGRELDAVLITSGAQQVMDLAAKALCNEGDTVICEAPSFIGSLNTFRSYNANLVGVPLEDDGINIELLEKALCENENVRFIYTIPTFQNPAGVTMSAEKRKAVYALAKKYGTLILEDNPYGELYYKEKPPASIKSLDDDGIVIYAGSFSKIISPGLRVGYAVAPQEVLQKMVVCKQGQDVHTNVWAQIICSKLISETDFNSHLEFLRNLYSEKAKKTEQLLTQHLAPKGVKFNRVDGGLFVWCTLPSEVPMQEFVKAAVEKKVCVVPGNAFLTDESAPCNSFRINFTTPTDEQVSKGIEILGTLL